MSLLVATSACSTVSDPDPLALRKYGAVTVQAKHNADGSASASTSAVFFDAYSATIPDSPQPAKLLSVFHCRHNGDDRRRHVASGKFNRPGVRRGVASTDFRIAIRSDAFAIYISGEYELRRGRFAARHGPRRSRRFPASAIAIRLAEPLAPQPIVLPAAGSPMTVRWNASPDTTTAIIISLKYANPATSTYPNEQIICALKDDGAEEFSAIAMGPVLASPATMRSLRLTRWRTQVVTPGTTSLLHIVSSIDTLIKLQ